jgi:DNA polymerase-3 subunit delta'
MSETASMLAVTSVSSPPWLVGQLQQLLGRQGQAFLLQGPSGLGQYSLGLQLAQSWLCDEPSNTGACGQCPSCHAIEVRTHPDLCVLMPETDMMELGWPLNEKAQADIDEKKRKPSKEIRIEAARDAVEFSQRSNARGRGKVVLIFPAERMNHVTANALLKTLEEPAGDLRFILASEATHQLLATIRSRCQVHSMSWPDESVGLQWLQEQGVEPNEAATALPAAGGRPADAMSFIASGRNPKSWRLLPSAMKEGDISLFKDWSILDVIDALQKLCHDLMVVSAGGNPRFFAPADLPRIASRFALGNWYAELARCRRTSEHPLNAGLMLEALVSQAQTALNSGKITAPT